jgi:hypothetical protein
MQIVLDTIPRKGSDRAVVHVHGKIDREDALNISENEPHGRVKIQEICCSVELALSDTKRVGAYLGFIGNISNACRLQNFTIPFRLLLPQLCSSWACNRRASRHPSNYLLLAESPCKQALRTAGTVVPYRRAIPL